MKKIRRNLKLEQEAFARAQRLTAFLQPEAKAKLDAVTSAMLTHLVSGLKGADFYVVTQKEVRSRFAGLSIKQSNLLNFYVLVEVAQILSDKDSLNERLEGMNEMSEMTSLRLQMTMDRRSKFISTLSQMMTKISTTQDTLVQNLK